MSVSTRDALRTALLYGLLAFFWLLTTDHLLNSYFDDSARLAQWQQVNGYVFALFSAVLIFFARARLFDFLGMNPGLKRQRQDQERLRFRPGFMPRKSNKRARAKKISTALNKAKT